jgi:hypothetical protein
MVKKFKNFWSSLWDVQKKYLAWLKKHWIGYGIFNITMIGGVWLGYMIWLNHEENKFHEKINNYCKDVKVSDLYGKEDEETE